MALESGTYVEDLNTSWPLGASDTKAAGDDHLRLIKGVLKNTFPGLAGRAWRSQAKSGNYTVVANDNMSVLRCTAALTLALTAAATLGNGHFVLVEAAGGDVTLDPNGAELVNGAATAVVPNGHAALVYCNGSAFFSFGLLTLSLITGLATLTGAQTLTNKTLTSPTINTPTVSGGTFTGQLTGIWTTGDLKLTLKSVADTGWVMFNDGTIGDDVSGGTARANADTEALFTLLWNNISNTWAPVSSGRGASAAADFAAHKTIALPKALGRALAVAGSGSGLTARALGENLGAETHVLTIAEMPAHDHDVLAGGAGSTASSATRLSDRGADFATYTNTTAVQNTGSGNAHNNMQPTTFLNVMVKL